jgi:hypothetical protein
MKTFRSIFGPQVLLVLLVSLVSSWFSLRYRLSLYVDFVILGLLVVFPLTLGIKEAFKRRERALQYLSAYKANLLALLHGLMSVKLDEPAQAQVRTSVLALSEEMHAFLLGDGHSFLRLEEATNALPEWMLSNRKSLKASPSMKLLLFFAKVREHGDFLIATKRHRTPVGLRVFLLVTIYAFVLFYPASLLHDQGNDLALWYVFAMTAFKGVLLMTLHGIREKLEDPFSSIGPDAIRLKDFRIRPGDVPPATLAATRKKGTGQGGEDDDE